MLVYSINDPSLENYANWLSSGIPDMVKGTFANERAGSVDHWLNSAGTAAAISPLAGKAVTSVTPKVGMTLTRESSAKALSKDWTKKESSAPKGAGAKLDKSLMDELAKSGAKYNADDVVMVTRTPEGELLWLEKGHSTGAKPSGLEHIVYDHTNDFARRGVTDIQAHLQKALNQKPIKTGINSRGMYAIYSIEGKNYFLAYGTNGYIVSFFPYD